ncbi:unnamed protein product, partial [marine sediment metagenome]
AGMVNITAATGTLTASGELVSPKVSVESATDKYEMTVATNALVIDRIGAGENSIIRMFTADGDSSDAIGIVLFNEGSLAGNDWIANHEALAFEWDTGADDWWEIKTIENGDGLSQPINMFTAGNEDQLFLDIDGDVGLGTVTPAATLHVAGDVNVSTHLVVGNNIGIGTTTPLYDLHIFDTGGNADIYMYADGDDVEIIFDGEENGQIWTIGNDESGSGDFIISEALGLGTPALTFTSATNAVFSGDVIIGETSAERG